MTDEACMPYTAGGGANMNCGAARCADWASRLTKISSYTNHSTMEARKAAVAAGPVLAGLEVWSDFFAYPAAGGVYVKSSAATRLVASWLSLRLCRRLRRRAAVLDHQE